MELFPRRYDDFLAAFDAVDAPQAIGVQETEPETVAAEGFLPRAALCAVFARAAYGALMRKGAGDRVGGFLGGAAKSFAGSWSDEDHTEVAKSLEVILEVKSRM